MILPKNSKKSDWEVELCIVVGTRASYVSEREALSYVAGYTVCNDLSEREFQMERGADVDQGQGLPDLWPVGPWLVTRDEVKNPQKLGMWLDVNGTRMQTGSTKTMIFSVAHIVSYASHFMTLEPGDLITTGTPPGVGIGMKPPRFLQPGDIIRLGIEGLGEQKQVVSAWREM